MPELPEVETTRLGILPHVVGQKIQALEVRHQQLRWPIPKSLSAQLIGQTVQDIERRGKYLLFKFKLGTLILHLGMSGHLRVLNEAGKAGKHDHVDFIFSRCILRYTDPRRFGAILWADGDALTHSLLRYIGPEPLTKAFSADYLWQKAQNKKVSIKVMIMDSKIVAGVGNIYAVEALFLAGIYPETPAGKLTKQQCSELCKAIKAVLKKAITKGGTTLRDYAQTDGKPGYFKQVLNVYGRANQPCRRCGTLLITTRLGQRSTVYCRKCQAR